jgi:Amidases related to nicotinamidase
MMMPYLFKYNNWRLSIYLFFGIESHVCVLQTAIDAKEMGFEPIVVVNAISSRKAVDKEIALSRMQTEGILLTTVEAIGLELCRVSGTDTFKAISKLIK